MARLSLKKLILTFSLLIMTCKSHAGFVTDKLNVDNIQIDTSTISSINTNGDINLNPNGTGQVKFPDLQADYLMMLDSTKAFTQTKVSIQSPNEQTSFFFDRFNGSQDQGQNVSFQTSDADGSTNAVGGQFVFTAGDGDGSGDGGQIKLFGGQAGATGQGGHILLKAGNNTTGGAADVILIPGYSAGNGMGNVVIQDSDANEAIMQMGTSGFTYKYLESRGMRWEAGAFIYRFLPPDTITEDVKFRLPPKGTDGQILKNTNAGGGNTEWASGADFVDSETAFVDDGISGKKVVFELSSLSNATHTWTFPNSSSEEFVGAGATQDLHNKTLDTSNIFADESDPTKTIVFDISGLSTATQRTVTFPNQNLDLSPIGARAHNSATSISGSLATVSWTTEDYDNKAALSGGNFTCPSTGKYHVAAAVAISGTLALNNTSIIEIQVDGTAVANKTQYIAAAVTNDAISIDSDVTCAAASVIRIQVSNSGIGPAIVSSDTRNYLSISRVAAF